MEQIQYQPTDIDRGYNPVTPVNLQPGLDNQSKIFKEDELRASQAGRLDDKNRLINAENAGKDLEALSKFSKTLTDYLVEEQEQKNEEDLQRGIMKAYYEGVPEQEQIEFKESEAQLTKAKVQADKLGEAVEQQTGDVFVADRFRNLSGWERYGFAQGLVMKAAAGFPAFYASAKSTAQITVDGEIITFDNARTEEQFAALQDQITRKYLSGFAGVNPKLLNEYLFPAVRRIQAEDSIEFTETQRQQRQQELKIERADALITTIDSGNASAQTFSDFILNHPQGPAAGKAELAELIRSGLEDGTLDPDKIDEFINEQEITFNDGSVGTLAGKNPSIFGFVAAAADDARTRSINRETQQLNNDIQEWENQTRETLREITARGGEITDADIQALRDDWQRKFPGREFPRSIQSVVTAERSDKQAHRDRLNALIDEKGFLSEADLMGVPGLVRADYERFIKAGKAIAEMPQRVSSDADRAIKQATRTATGLAEGVEDLNSAGLRISRAARRDFERLYASYMAKGSYSEQDAMEAALSIVEGRIAKGDYSGTIELGDDTTETRIQSTRDQLEEDPSLLSTKQFLTPKELQQAQAAYEGKPGAEYPRTVRMLAGELGIDPWTFTQAQLAAFGIESESKKPEAEELVDGQNPEIRDLLRRKPSASRTHRAVVQSEDTKFFLDTIASVESEAHGGYNAMNTGGSGIGPSNRARGSANSCDVTGCLSEMTIGDIINLQRSGKVFAAGRYQFIPTTLLETVQQLGLSLDTPFNAETQDLLAIGRLRWRLSVQNSTLGLRNEWQGLWHLSDSEVQDLLEIGREISVYRQNKNLLPALRS